MHLPATICAKPPCLARCLPPECPKAPVVKRPSANRPAVGLLLASQRSSFVDADGLSDVEALASGIADAREEASAFEDEAELARQW
eukprot:7177929-Prymnesium_polylepis.1